MKYIFSIALIIVGSLAFLLVACQPQKMPEKHLEILLRDIGHHLLLYARDSTSRVLPIEKIADNIYQISFQNSLTFEPDTLVHLVYQRLKKEQLVKDYIVNVLDCRKQTTIFAFEINTSMDNLAPCSGRKPEEGCYLIQIEFLNPSTFNFLGWFVLCLPLGIVLFYLKQRQSKISGQEQKNTITKSQVIKNQSFISIGKYKFQDKKNLLMLANERIELSEKETKALKIFVEQLNEVIARERFMNELWQDEGIFVINRNLDVLVSKLRKKLSGDENIKITNVHGKGYKLTIV